MSKTRITITIDICGDARVNFLSNRTGSKQSPGGTMSMKPNNPALSEEVVKKDGV